MEAEEGMPRSRSTALKPTNNLQADNLHASGQDAVLVTSLYAIIGAVALERGGEAANKIVQQRILEPLGFNFAE